MTDLPNTRQELEAEGIVCSCHLNPPCNWCLAPVACNGVGGKECNAVSDDWVEAEDTTSWWCAECTKALEPSDGA